jgi:glutathione S-transferase
MTSRAIWGEDLMAGLPVRDYLTRMRERPAVKRVDAERKANAELMARERPLAR